MMSKQAMYIHRNGAIRIEAPYAESNGPARIVNYETLVRRNPFAPISDYTPVEPTLVKTERLTFRLAYESIHYFIYEEV